MEGNAGGPGRAGAPPAELALGTVLSAPPGGLGRPRCSPLHVLLKTKEAQGHLVTLSLFLNLH